MAQSGCIQDDACIRLKSCFLQFVDERPFMIRLEIVQLKGREISFQNLQIRFKRHVAVDIRLPPAKQVEIRAIEDEDFGDQGFFRCQMPDIRC